MAVSNTGTMFKSLTFDGADSRDYGVYITGAGVYNAPQREVEMISIPNRNGSFALDKGRFENIEVTYPAGIYADSETDFADAISEFRNLLCSKNGYCRLTDEYNPDEYRMAIYKSGLDVEPAQLRAGEFDIVFECMPQRYLTSGETEITVTSGQTLTNPTRFDAKPLIMLNGNGVPGGASISFNGHTIALQNEPIGHIILADSAYASALTGYQGIMDYYIDATKVDSTDSITLTNTVVKVTYRFNTYNWTAVSYSEQSGYNPPAHTLTHRRIDNKTIEFVLTIPTITLIRGNTWTGNFVYDTTFTLDGSTSTDELEITINYTPATGLIRVRAYKLPYLDDQPDIVDYSTYFGKIDTTSTQWSLGNPTYIDCEQGEAYKYVDGQYTSVNPYVSLGSDLPTLASGPNKVSYSATITSLKIVPRWWRV